MRIGQIHWIAITIAETLAMAGAQVGAESGAKVEIRAAHRPVFRVHRPLVAQGTANRHRPQTEGPTATSALNIRAAVNRAIAPIEKSMAMYRQQRQCFSCHHHAHPIIALSQIARRGFEIDPQNLQRQLDMTIAETESVRERYTNGKSIGGGVDTAGYTLMAMQAGGHPPDETTRAVVDWLLARDINQGFWTGTRSRAPTQTSDVTRTWLCIQGLRSFGPDDAQEQIAERLATARKWVLQVEATTTEDQVSRLRALRALGDDDLALAQFAVQLAGQQRADGGWAQTPDLQSDAYATATALMALHQASGLPTDNVLYQRGVEYLLSTQLPDGTWRVSTRATPVQVYFESGFPHGEDQFISMTATCWAAAALADTVPAPEEAADD